MSLLVRTQDSVNIFDTGIGGVYRTFDPEVVLKEAREVLEAHLNPIALPDVEKLPVLGSPDMFGRAWSNGLSGQKLARTPPLVRHGGAEAVCGPLHIAGRPVLRRLLPALF